jgi:predicted membrane channel-forming protein YqfA (hemolysin III family)
MNCKRGGRGLIFRSWYRSYPPSPSQIALLLVVSMGSVLGTAVCCYRSRLTRESPLWLLCLNGLPALTTMGTYVRWALSSACPLGDQHHAVAHSVIMFCGFTLYVTKLPERVWPGRFDIVGNSHQIWHVAYVCGLAMIVFDCFCSAEIRSLSSVAVGGV